jgi:regulation of enolase protein 1 (concanavalin A-like superfamily)
MTEVLDNVEAYRRQVERILASPEFASSQQLRDFLFYVSQAAFDGQQSVNQESIAREVLRRGSDFNPLDDASVRRLATLTRQRLEKYYSSTGAHDSVFVTLPLRSYVPKFQRRNSETGALLPDVANLPQPDSFIPAGNLRLSRRTSRVLLISGSLLVCILLAYGLWQPVSQDLNPEIVLHTVRGDIMHEVNDVPGRGILLGPEIGPADELTVRMRFTPERAHQQAGLLVFQDADHYVKLSRHFVSRTQLEFGIEVDGHYLKPKGTFAYEPQGQNGEPLWLSVRRNGNAFSAFVSYDGENWKRFGNTLEATAAMPHARIGIFAFHGRTDSVSAEARFDHLGFGPSFHDYADGIADLRKYSGWEFDSTCPGAIEFDHDSLVFPFGGDPQACDTNFLKPAPRGDWALTTKLDFLPASGSAAGLVAVGSQGASRLLRWGLNGGTISAEQYNGSQVNRRDFEGAPPIVMRIESRGDLLSYSFSRDDRDFVKMPIQVRRSSLGRNLRIGIQVSTSSWSQYTAPSPARFSYLRQDVTALSAYR